MIKYLFSSVFSICIVILISWPTSASPIATFDDNSVKDDAEWNTNATSYYELLAQFGKNRFHFNPTLPKRGLKIQKKYKFRPNKPEFAKRDFAGEYLEYKPNDGSQKNPVSSNSIIFKNNVLPYGNDCGRSLFTNSLIINGNKVQVGLYPWMVAIFLVKSIGVSYLCCGSLISTKHVVTAAHCVRSEAGETLSPSEVLNILGKLNLQKWVPSSNERIIEAQEVVIHPDYEPLNSDADIAVIVLSEDVKFTRYIKPLCLWSGDDDLKGVVGQKGIVAGWGKDGKGNLMTAEPKQTILPIVSQHQCLSSSYQFHYITSNRTFCAGSRNGIGPCNGDSGSGLIMNRDGRWMLRGVVSMSISDTYSRTCDLKNYVVFTDASKFLSWLLSFIK